MATEQQGKEAEGSGSEKEDLVLRENADGSVVISDPDAGSAVAEEDEDDAAPVTGGANSSDDDGPTEAEELRLAADDAAREAIRARRRRERKERKVAAHEREQGLRDQLAQTQRQLNEMSERFNIMDRKTSGAELAQLDNAIQAGAGAVEHFTAALAEAASTNNGAAQAEAISKLLTARERVKELTSIRQQIANPRRTAPAMDPVVARNAQAWAEKNKWYDVRGGDDDSRIVLALDQSLSNDGFHANTPAYWQELDKRVAKYLPHRRTSAGDDGESSDAGGNGGKLPSDVRKPGKSVVTGSGREAAAGGRPTEITLSADRVQALKDAGYWNDPVQRNAMIKKYREYDRAAANGKSS